ncbi:MAG TPA: QueG-associated DUF1730 domain-containing protein [Parafilimonas sp.]|nr:QueG-associated DUF1730 domain-containing protein [Parafilimonas sp.]
MENYFDLRTDPRQLVPGAKSVIILLLNYLPAAAQQPGTPKVSKYAYGKDYHEVIREKLNHFIQLIKENIGDVNGRCFLSRNGVSRMKRGDSSFQCCIKDGGRPTAYVVQSEYANHPPEADCVQKAWC